MKRLISVPELSEMIGVKVSTLYEWVSKKSIPYVKVGRLTKFDEAKIDKWIVERSVEPRNIVDRF